ncbi:hypothetical protein [Bradyrhizobium rifense]|uniref:hypothetical protein n=1 Tax=Bradyrhizobium rifense TaxID=515499 RepID=UPI0016530911|nr:hypothetical protein [Bradyrhizobium rifense]
MRVLLINVPHPSIGSRIPDDHLPPLGLLAIGGTGECQFLAVAGFVQDLLQLEQRP